MDTSNTVNYREFNVGPRFLNDFETGALLHALLAWPKASEEEELKTAANALCVGVIEATLKQDPGRRALVEKTFPHYITMDAKARKRALRLLQKRLNRRMVAARMSLGFLGEGLSDWKAKLPSGMTRLSIDQLARRMVAARMSLGYFAEGLFNCKAKLPPGITRLSVDKLSKLVQPGQSIDDPENIEKLIWRTSLPAVHLAAAFQVVGRLRDGMEGTFYTDLNDIDLYRKIVDQAYLHELIMLTDPRFGKRRGEFIRIRWVK